MPRGKARTAATARKPRAPNLPAPFVNGTILKDLRKKEWKLGDEVGKGGFGLIYLAAEDVDSPVAQTAEHVIKIEPHSNGPLFCELHFYQRVSKPEMINAWANSRKLKYLGVPKYITHGNHTRGNENFRFLVMPRFGTDLQKIFEGCGKQFSKETVLALGLRMVDALEYLHENGYVHADIKASNILLGFDNKQEQQDQVYLVDYGLVLKYSPDGSHKEYKEDPRKAHDGTIEFTSTDAHKGVAPSRRGDMEILAFCMLQWLCGKLPWEDKLLDKNYVADSKIRYMEDIPALMRACFSKGESHGEISKFLTLILKLGYEEKPDYNKYKTLFKDGLKKLGVKDEWKLHLPVAGTSAKKSVKRKSEEASECSTPKKKVRGTPKVATTSGSLQHTPKPAAKPRQGTPQTARGTPQRARGRGTPQTARGRGTPRTGTPRATASRASIKSPMKGDSVNSPQTIKSPAKVQTVKSPVKSPSKGNNSKPSTRRKVKRSRAKKVDAWVQTSPR
ncbi:serine/threonine-protein kinase VRK1-like [Ostrea edulis]|uniref:serine/threonine-protein kinase VRK1-like n=1 Tax=Ostrea edulis TaxID=37623 RepID=UPI0024AF7C92|nr:serine/threonine-protein kinase VRK1-like [Ostrea edulis]